VVLVLFCGVGVVLALLVSMGIKFGSVFAISFDSVFAVFFGLVFAVSFGSVFAISFGCVFTVPLGLDFELAFDLVHFSPLLDLVLPALIRRASRFDLLLSSPEAFSP
jgi:hypothetical protein